MSRPPIEVADIVRAAGESFFESSRKWLTWLHLKVLNAILRCRTAALGGHVDACSKCGHAAVSYNSCRNRHCPKCQANARDRWLEARAKELLPTRYVHVVFTLPRQLSPLALQNKREIYALLFRASAETLLEVARDPKRLGAEIGFFSVLHTWNQKLQHHPHVHCVVPSGGLAPDHSRWIHSPLKFFLPVKVLGRVFRGKFVDGLKALHAKHRLSFHGSLTALQNPKAFAAWLRPLFRSPWVVYSKRPFGGAQHALRYLGQYTHRVAISNHRLVALTDGMVTFRWRDSAHKNKKRLMTLPVNEFLRRFLLHVLPPGFVRIRHFGLMAHRRRSASLPLCLQLLAESGQVGSETSPEEKPGPPPQQLWSCPYCGGPMVLIQRLTAMELRLRSPPVPTAQQL
jgi:putative transposase/transposase-like zinc-binding protein